MCQSIPRLALLICFVSVAVAPVSAGPTRRGPDGPLAAATTGIANPPIGWVEHCGREPAECSAPDLPARDLTLTPAALRLLTSVNDGVNREIAPVTDAEQWGVAERWDFAETGRGDCEDYVLLKRRRLVAAGVPRQALLVTVVRDETGDGHAVLTVKTDRGDFVLDNQRAEILPWTATGYRFVKRQSQTNPNVWVGVEPGRPALVATSR